MDKTEMKETLENADAGSEKFPAKEKEQQVGETGPENKVNEQEKDQVDKNNGETDPSEKLKEELEGAKDKYLRLYSEFENFRKRTAKEKLDLIQSANEQLLQALLPVADDFERAENAFDDKNDKELAGFFLIHSKFKKVLELYGVKTMPITQGSDFDADLHEAISQVPAPSPELKGKIVDVVEKGYLLNEKVIRYAKVVVGN